MTLKKKKAPKKVKVTTPSFSQVSYSLQEVTNILDTLESNCANYSKPSKDLLAKIYGEWASSKEASKNKDSQRIVPFLKGIAAFYAT